MIHVSRRIDLEGRVRARAAAAKLNHLPLFRAAADGRHTLALITASDGLWPSRIGKHYGPQVVLVGDDPYPAGEALGPDAWGVSARRATVGALCRGSTGPEAAWIITEWYPPWRRYIATF